MNFDAITVLNVHVNEEKKKEKKVAMLDPGRLCSQVWNTGRAATERFPTRQTLNYMIYPRSRRGRVILTTLQISYSHTHQRLDLLCISEMRSCPTYLIFIHSNIQETITPSV